MLRIVVIVATLNKKQRYMSLKVTKSKICITGMLVGIGLIGLLPVLSEAGLIVYKQF